MARQISRAEAYERAHEVFSQINFTSFDYNTIKQSLIDYVQLYFPEDFSDYIESSEFLAQLELFAYVGELMAYRIDMNAHENFITTAQRKESVLRLAKLISYKASRNIPNRGMVKMTSVQTTETVYDSIGRNLSNRKIIWNDPNNPDWKEQFLLVMNRVLEQDFGTVTPDERVQVDDVLFELYTLNNNPITQNDRSVFSYNATVSGQDLPMEVVPVNLTTIGPIERRPEINAKFSLMYGSDGLGDGSDTTGFLMFSKQGTLQRISQIFDGVTPNQTFDIPVDNINETDIFVNNIDPDTRQVLINDPYINTLPHLVSQDLRYGDWIEVDLANAQNIIFNTNKNRHKYEIETLDNDNVRLVFGDGEFSDIPNGSFDIWYRTSVNEDVSIPKSAIVDKSSTFTYTDINSSVQTLTFSFSSISSMQNGTAAETIEHIRRVAPSVYYTQDRMVNGRDYNTFPLQDPSILKLRTINRTFAGDSKYIAWHDARENYEDVKLFGDDLAVYWDEKDPISGGIAVIPSPVSPTQLLLQSIQPLLSSTDFFLTIGPEIEALGGNPGSIRRTFNSSPYTEGPGFHSLGDNEVDALTAALTLSAAGSNPIIDIYYSTLYNEWTVDAHPSDIIPNPPFVSTAGPAKSIFMIRVQPSFGTGSILTGWDVRYRTRTLTAESNNTRFWNTNQLNQLLNFDTLNSVTDKIIVLQANSNANGTGLLSANKEYGVVSQRLLEQNLANAGLPDINRLSIVPVDTNEDGIPDNLLQPELFDVESVVATGPVVAGAIPDITLIRSYLVGHEDEDVEFNVVDGSGNKTQLFFSVGDWFTPPPDDNPSTLERFLVNFPTLALAAGETLVVKNKDYVYFSRDSVTDPYTPGTANLSLKTLFLQDEGATDDERRYKRHEGRFPLNFAWFHFTPRLNLIDPSPSNIHDMYIITVGYYNDLQRYLKNQSNNEPTLPTPFELRSSYADTLENKMMSDGVILHPGKFKILFGSRAEPALQAKFKLIRPSDSTLTDNEVKVRIVAIVQRFFSVTDWEFGEQFFFTELVAAIHAELGPEIDSLVLVPLFAQTQFGDLFQIQAKEDELFIADISTADIEIVQSFTPTNIRQ